jgi:DNA-binding transcriptional regulator YhcF (GntR family)
MSIGLLKLHRQIQDCSLWVDDEPFDRRSAWVDLLLLVNHEPKRILVDGKGKTIETGQRLTSTLKLAERWRWSVSRVRRFLTLLEEEQMITTERTTKGTLLTVTNYGVYQGLEMGERTTLDTTVDIAVDTTGDTTVDTTVEQRSIQRSIHKQEIKNDKNEKNEKNDKNEKNIKRVYFPDDEALNDAFADFVDNRKKLRKPMTDKAIDLQIKKINELSGGDNDKAIALIENAIMRGWLSVFPIKEQKQETTSTGITDWSRV